MAGSTSGHDWPGREEYGADVGGGNGIAVGLERLMDDEGIDDEHLPGRCRQAAGTLVEVLEIGGFEVEVGPDRGRDALSRARNRIYGGNHCQIRHRAPRRAP